MKLSQQEVAAIIVATCEKNGDIAADALWQAARSPNHPLHSRYQWDEKAAAVEHWRQTSRQLIASCRVEIVVDEISYNVPRYVRDPDKAGGDQGYSSVDRMGDDRDRATRALDAELRRLKAAFGRAQSLAVAFRLEDRFRAEVRRIAGSAIQPASNNLEKALS